MDATVNVGFGVVNDFMPVFLGQAVIGLQRIAIECCVLLPANLDSQGLVF